MYIFDSNREQGKLNDTIMNIYTESEVVLMAGPEALAKWKEDIKNPPVYRRILKKDDIIKLSYYNGMDPWPGTVLKTHIASSHITYDLIVTFPDGNSERMYNVQASYVQEVLFGDNKRWDEVTFTENK
jgi:hypothetical protein